MAHALPPSPDRWGGTLLPHGVPWEVALPPHLMPADIGFSHGAAWYSGAIRWFTRHRGERPTFANHTFGLGPGLGPGRDLSVVEALGTVKRTQLAAWEPPREFEIFRHRTLSPAMRLHVSARAESYVGNVYGGPKIVPHLLDGLLGKIAARDVYAFRRVCFLPRYPICSWLWAWAYGHFAIRTSACDKRHASPDDQHDYMTGPGALQWALVAKRFPDGDLVVWNDTTGYPVWPTSPRDTAMAY